MKSLALAPAAERLLEKTFSTAVARARSLQRTVLATASFEIPPLHPLEVLRKWDDDVTPWLFWQCKDTGASFLAWARALELQAQGEHRFSEIDKQWRALCAEACTDGPIPPRLCGGFRFDTASQREDHWLPFADASLMVGSIVFLQQEGKHYMLCQHMVSEADNASQLTSHFAERYLHSVSSCSPSPVSATNVETLNAHNRDRGDWEQKVRDAICTIQEDVIQKVVLARSQILPPRDRHAADVLAALLRRQEGAFVYGCRRGNCYFVGASPERLVRLEDQIVSTQALAGTAARSNHPSEDARLAHQLLHSEKDLQEHRIVVEQIRSALIKCCENLSVPERPVITRLNRLQHLNTPISGRASRSSSILELAQQLHPTPAVAGYPKTKALEYIRTHEQQDRGWYAAPLGWIDAHNEGDFLVALRCALFTPHGSHLYAGCGIVQDSNPGKEFEETNIKLWAMLNALESKC